MERDISPPPSKRRKVSADIAIDTATQASPPTAPSLDAIRIFSWNINGIAPFIQKSITSFFTSTRTRSAPSSRTTTQTTLTAPAQKQSSASLRAFLRRHSWPHLLFVQEVKISPQDERTQRAVQAAVNAREGTHDDGPDYQVRFTLPRDKYNARGFGGRVYGVASIVRSDLMEKEVERVRDVDWDLEGRISVVETRSKLAIFNVYAVNGTTNPYKSPETGQVVGTRHDRKLAFHRLLMEECKRLEAKGWRLVLAGDFNIARAAIDGYPNLRTFPHQHVLNRADFNAKFFTDEDGLKAMDVWREMKGSERRYTYFPRGRQWGTSCDRVDFIMVSRELWEQRGILGTEIWDTPQERGPSDHVPLSVEVSNVAVRDQKVDESVKETMGT